MSKPRVPSYRHRRPSGQAVVTLNGRDHYLGAWGEEASRQEYERLIGEWLANGRRLPHHDAKNDLRVCELLSAYLTFANGYSADDRQPGREYVCMKAAAKPLIESYSRSGLDFLHRPSRFPASHDRPESLSSQRESLSPPPENRLPSFLFARFAF